MTDLEWNSPTNRFRLRISIVNTGEKGNLDFSKGSGTAYTLNANQSSSFASGFLEATNQGRARTLLETLKPATFRLSNYLDLTEQSSSRPMVAAGHEWQGWLVFYGKIPPDAVAMIIRISEIVSPLNTSSWLSYTEGQPFIPLSFRRN